MPVRQPAIEATKVDEGATAPPPQRGGHMRPAGRAVPMAGVCAQIGTGSYAGHDLERGTRRRDDGKTAGRGANHDGTVVGYGCRRARAGKYGRAGSHEKRADMGSAAQCRDRDPFSSARELA